MYTSENGPPYPSLWNHLHFFALHRNKSFLFHAKGELGPLLRSYSITKISATLPLVFAVLQPLWIRAILEAPCSSLESLNGHQSAH
jgi:hypothetical protein